MAGVEDIPDSKDLTCTICNDLFTDARALSCAHTFCLACIRKKSDKKCPECSEETIPENMECIDQLSIAEQKNSLVGRVMEERVRKSSYWRSRGGQDNTNEKNNDTPVHEGVTCSNCEKKDFAGVRYICGVCPGYNLCEECEDEPKSHKHDKTHIFVKLKRPATKPLPEGSILTELGVKMGEVMDFNSNIHRVVVEEVAPGMCRVGTTDCDRCNHSDALIEGIRYYCGMCIDYDLCEECEKRSDIVHDPNHVFMKIRHPVGEIVPGATESRLVKPDFY